MHGASRPRAPRRGRRARVPFGGGGRQPLECDPLAHAPDRRRVCAWRHRAQRVEYFKGSKLVDALVGPRYKGKLAAETPIKTRAEAAKLAQELLRVGYIHRSQRVTHAHSRRWELELFHGPFEEDGLFTWVYEGERPPARPPCHWLWRVLRRRCGAHQRGRDVHDAPRRCTTLHDAARCCTTLHDAARGA